jgi:hypothetical protein
LQLQHKVPGTAIHEINYAAIPVGYGGLWHYKADYKQSVQDGVNKLTSYANAFFASSCANLPTNPTRLFMAGYSQGAEVVGDVYQSLGPGKKAKVGGISLIADPRWNKLQGSPVSVGDYNPNLNGTPIITTPRSLFTRHETTVVRSYCMLHDPICNGSAANFAACKASPDNCVHLFYTTTTYLGITYTTLAANHLYNRFKAVGGPPQPIGPKSNILIFGQSNGESNETEAMSNMSTALTAAGYTVTVTDMQPLPDLTPYGQVWVYGSSPVSPTDASTLVSYVTAGGSVLMSGDYVGCCGLGGGDLDSAVATVFNSLVSTVGGIQFGTSTDNTMPINPGAIDAAATSPNALTSFTGADVGYFDQSNINPQNILARDSAGHGIIGLWDQVDMQASGRLAIVMDINWPETGYGDMTTMGPVTQNLAYFLSY